MRNDTDTEKILHTSYHAVNYSTENQHATRTDLNWFYIAKQTEFTTMLKNWDI
jgi:hypothetical protein